MNTIWPGSCLKSCGTETSYFLSNIGHLTVVFSSLANSLLTDVLGVTDLEDVVEHGRGVLV